MDKRSNSIKRSIVSISACLVVLIAIFSGSVVKVFGAGGSVPEEPSMTGLRVATFDVDATPPVGYDLGGVYGIVTGTWDMGLRAKGIVLLGAGEPIVLMAIDWIGLYDESHDQFRETLADAVRTDTRRVAVHSVHQHDAPRSSGHITCDWVLATLQRIQMAARTSIDQAQPVTHIGFGEAEVYKVASNRRILGEDGRVRAGRMSSCRDAELRAEPEGVIDPMVSLVSFWNKDKPLAVLTYYATHPQSYYLTGVVNPDFPGIARFFRQLAVPDALHVHFTGAGGNIAAGKYNDGSPENRLILAERLADGMKRAWESSQHVPVNASGVEWRVEPVPMVSDTLNKSNLQFGFVQRYMAGKKIDLQCLAINDVRILFAPGELFIEYQLAAKAMRPDLFVTMAAYGDGGPGYIPTAEAFNQGGYEVRERLTPEIEEVLMTGLRKLLDVK
jgi:hypothetical protein